MSGISVCGRNPITYSNESYFSVVLLITEAPVVLFVVWMISYVVTIQMKATEQYFPRVLFIILYKVVLTFEPVDEILWCDHSNESY